MSTPTLELLVTQGTEAGELVLACPTVGHFTCAVDKGGLLAPGATAGVLHVLGVPHELRVPAGVQGRVVNARPELVRAPVGHGSPLYTLAPIGDAASDPAFAGAAGTSSDSGLVFRAPYSGRFWHRAAPGEPAFVEAGAEVAAGDTLGLIEVMKTFTHLHYAADGDLPPRAKVVRLIAGDGEEVAQGDALLELEPVG